MNIPNLPSEEDILIAKARKKYIDYISYVYHGNWIAGKHHKIICDKLDDVIAGKIKRLMFFLPPRHGKSMCVTKTFPSYYLGKFPDKRVLEVSYGEDLAKEFGESNRKKVEEFGLPVFDINVSATQSSKVDWNIENHYGGMVSVGVGGGITGKGADLLILDDPIKNRTEAESERFRRYLYSEWQSSIYTRLHPNATVIIILTRWHEDDLAARLIKESPDEWDIVSLPCICDSDDDLLCRKIGEPLWPEHGFDKRWAETTKKTVGSYAWSSLYQQSPTPAGGSIIKRSWIKYYDSLPLQFDKIVQSWDCSFKDNSDNDYVSGQIWGKLGINYYLLDRVHDRMGIVATINAIKAMSAKWKEANSIFIEDKANGTAVVEMLKNQIPGIIPVEPKGGKIVRTQAVAPFFEAGNVYLPDPSIKAWVGDFVEEVLSFPNGQNDDDVDSMSQAITNMQTAYNAKIYPSFSVNNIIDDVQASDIIELAVGVHFGNNSCSAASVIGFTKNYKNIVVLDELSYNHEVNSDFTTITFTEELKELILKNMKKYKNKYFTLIIRDGGKTMLSPIKKFIAGVTIRSIDKHIDENIMIHLSNTLIDSGRLYLTKELIDIRNSFENSEFDNSYINRSEVKRSHENSLHNACVSSVENVLFKFKRYLEVN